MGKIIPQYHGCVRSYFKPFQPFHSAGFSIHVLRISIQLPILYILDHDRCLNYDAFLSLKINFIFANSADIDEMSHYNAAFQLDFHFLLKYLFAGIWNKKSSA